MVSIRPRCSRSRLAGALLALVVAPAWSQSQPFIGQIMCAPYNFAPTGWAFADGSILPINTNTPLFSLIGTTYGGNGTTTFALPDLRGRVMVAAGQGPGTSNRLLGETGGAESVTLGVAQLPAHAHQYAPPASTSDASVIPPNGAVPSEKARTTLFAPASQANTTLAAAITGTTGGSAPVPTMPPFATVNCFIATAGVFPSRP